MSRASSGSSVRAIRLDGMLGAAACVVTWIAFLPFARFGIDAHHDGLMLKTALDVWRGATLFRDTFCQYGALTPYLHALGFPFFGPNLLAIRLVTVILYGLTAGVLVLTWRLFLPRGLVLIAFLIWLMRTPFLVGLILLPWSSVPALLFQSVAMLCVVIALERGSAAPAAVAGAAAGLAFLARQPVGGLTVIALTLAFGCAMLAGGNRAEGGRQLAACLAGFGLVLGGFAAQLLWSGSLVPWLLQTVIWPSRWLQGFTPARTLWSLLPFPALSVRSFGIGVGGALGLRLFSVPRWSDRVAIGVLFLLMTRGATTVEFVFGTTGALVLGLVSALGVALGRLCRPGTYDRHDAATLAALLVATAAWAQMYPVGDFHHPSWALAPGTGLVVHAMWRASGRRTVLVALLFAVFFGPIALGVVLASRMNLAVPRERISMPAVLAGIETDAATVRDLERLGQAIAVYAENRPDVSVLLEGPDALYATLGPSSVNPGPFFIVWPGLASIGVAERVALITRDHPLVFRQGGARPAVQRALDDAGYRVVVTIPAGSLLAAE